MNITKKKLVGVRPETGKFGRDQGMRKIIPQTYGRYFEDKILSITQISGKLAIYGWALVIITLTGILITTNAFGSGSSSQERGRGGHQGPPPEAYSACEGKSEGDTAEFVSPRGDTVTGTCELERDSDRLVLRPDNPPEGDSGGRPMRGDRD